MLFLLVLCLIHNVHAWCAPARQYSVLAGVSFRVLSARHIGVLEADALSHESGVRFR